MKWILPLCLVAAPAIAENCPPVTDHSLRLSEIVTELRRAGGESEARVLTQELWSLWTDAPDELAQSMLDEVMSRRASYDFLGARDVLTRLVDYCPDYAEGYNQRAFVNFLREDFEPALVDLDLALERSPNHVAALSGKALTLMGLGRAEEAQDVLREAVKLNPWIPERGLLTVPLGEEL